MTEKREHRQYQGTTTPCWCGKFHPTTSDELMEFVKARRWSEVDLFGFAKAICGPQQPDCAICGIATKFENTCSQKCADVQTVLDDEPVDYQAHAFAEKMAKRAMLSRSVAQHLLGENRRLKEALRTKVPVQKPGVQPPDKEIESLESMLGDFSIDRISEEIEAGTSGCAGAPVPIRTDYLRWMVWATRQCVKLLSAYKIASLGKKEAEEKLEHNKCHSGHETLPLKLWDCPACHDETKTRLKVAEKERDEARAKADKLGMEMLKWSQTARENRNRAEAAESKLSAMAAKLATSDKERKMAEKHRREHMRKRYEAGQKTDAMTARAERLKSALRGADELFDNYGFADESPCVRDREIVRNMHEALAFCDKTDEEILKRGKG